jgi:hypothetical protein
MFRRWSVLARARARVFPDLDQLVSGRVVEPLACRSQGGGVGRSGVVAAALEDQRGTDDGRVDQQPPGGRRTRRRERQAECQRGRDGQQQRLAQAQSGSSTTAVP